MRHFTVKICCEDEELGDRGLASYEISDGQRKDRYFREMAFKQFESWLEKESSSIEPVYLGKLIDPAQLAYAVYVGENQGNPNFLQLTDEDLKLALESNLEKMEKALPFQNVQQRESVDDLNKRARTILENMKK